MKYKTALAGCLWVALVSFDERTWQDPPLPELGKSRTIRLRAIFEVAADQETKANQVWTGRALSPEDAYTIYH